MSSGATKTVTLTAYFDESGHPKDPKIPYFGLGGIVAAAADWARLDKRWRDMLADEELPAIHMTDLIRSREAFKDKKVWTEARRQALIKRCFSIASDCLKPSVAGGYYVAFEPGRDRVSTVEMYLACFGKLLRGLEERFRPYPPPLDLVIAAQTEIPVARLAEQYARWGKRHPRFRNFSMGSPHQCAPLQLADMAAFLLGTDHREDRGLQPLYDSLFPKGIFSRLDLLLEEDFREA